MNENKRKKNKKFLANQESFADPNARTMPALSKDENLTLSYFSKVYYPYQASSERPVIPKF